MPTPGEIIAYVGAFALALIFIALAVLVVWSVVQTVRGKSPRQQREAARREQGGTTIIGRDRR